MYPEKGMIQSGQVPLPEAFDERNRNWEKRMKWMDGLDEEDRAYRRWLRRIRPGRIYVAKVIMHMACCIGGQHPDP